MLMERIRSKSRLVSSVVLWAVVLTVWTQISISPGARAADIDGGFADGSTYCDVFTCDADVQITLFSFALDVNNGDDVWYYYDISWQDERAWVAPLAVHHFEMTVIYPGRPAYVAYRYVNTAGNEGGTDTLTIEVPNVSEGAVVTVTWFAEITVPYPSACYDSDSDGGGQGYG
jgi:hypothetical protein